MDASAFASTKNAYNRLPMVTLYFDATERCTIAVLSQPPNKLLNVYLQCRIEHGTARKKSPLYYILEGFIRENHLSLTRQYQNKASIRIATGAAEASDAIQVQDLELERSVRLSFFHGHFTENQERRGIDLALLEEALEAARLHRLCDDLDVLSVYFMQQSCPVLALVAERIIAERLKNLSLNLTFFENGVPCRELLSFDRATVNGTIAIMTEDDGRNYIYHERPSLQLSFVNAANPLLIQSSGKHSFHWACRETMPLWRKLSDWIQQKRTGDVYQKLQVSWSIPRHSPDAVPWMFQYKMHGSFQKNLLLATAKIDPVQTSGSFQRWHIRSKRPSAPLQGPLIPHNPGTDRAQLSILAEIENTVQQNSSARIYSGCVKIQQVQINFELLAVAWVKASEDYHLLTKLGKTETRPLTHYEQQYKDLVQEMLMR